VSTYPTGDGYLFRVSATVSGKVRGQHDVS
jgi:hypothetical protein